ncbi:hypothetical protein IF2G_04819 [Cordyceps javanica]|nr:hypothetical protein IF2G_04819 [Cordyceps javanica]
MHQNLRTSLPPRLPTSLLKVKHPTLLSLHSLSRLGQRHIAKPYALPFIPKPTSTARRATLSCLRIVQDGIGNLLRKHVCASNVSSR